MVHLEIRKKYRTIKKERNIVSKSGAIIFKNKSKTNSLKQTIIKNEMNLLKRREYLI